MAGSFGHMTQYYNVAMAAGSEPLDQFTRRDGRTRTVDASGTSCFEQLGSRSSGQIHPVELIVPIRAVTVR